MVWQEVNNVFVLMLLFYGVNVVYIEDFYVSYKMDLNLVDFEWQDFFVVFQDEKDVVLKEVWGVFWKCKDWLIEVNGDLVNVFDGNWVLIEKQFGDKLKKKVEVKGEFVFEMDVFQFI